MARRRRERPRGPIAMLVLATALITVFVLLVLPLAVVVIEAFREGPARWANAVSDPATLAAVKLTALVVIIVVPLQAVFGVIAAYAITRFDFPGKGALVTILDLPFATSPIVSGLLFVLLFGARGIFGPYLIDHGIRIVYAVPGIVLATLFVTLPFVTRELIPILQAQGRDEEEAAAGLGAGAFAIIMRVTLPRIRWGVLYGALLCAARAAGEFGAVSVVSGHIRGETNTLPLHVEVLYGEYDFVGAFAVASLLALMGVATLGLKEVLERRAASPTRIAKMEAAE